MTLKQPFLFSKNIRLSYPRRVGLIKPYLDFVDSCATFDFLAFLLLFNRIVQRNLTKTYYSSSYITAQTKHNDTRYRRHYRHYCCRFLCPFIAVALIATMVPLYFLVSLIGGDSGFFVSKLLSSRNNNGQ